MPIAGTTVWPTTGMKPKAKRSDPEEGDAQQDATESRAEIHSSRQSGSPDSWTSPPSPRSTSSESDS